MQDTQKPGKFPGFRPLYLKWKIAVAGSTVKRLPGQPHIYPRLPHTLCNHTGSRTLSAFPCRHTITVVKRFVVIGAKMARPKRFHQALFLH
jgi:hypothetical protein